MGPRASGGAGGNRGPPGHSVAFDWAMVTLSGWLLGGLYLDGWAHRHVSLLDTFFTPWHGVLYSGMLATFVFLTASAVRYRRRGHAWRQSLPPEYGLSFLGVLLFGVGGMADMTWHLLFGIEHGVDALLSPTHLLLAAAGALIGMGPLRSVWRRTSAAPSWVVFLPALLSLTYLLTELTFFTQFAHPVVEPMANERPLPDPQSEVFVMAADGSSQTRLIATPGRDVLAPSWSADGRRLVYASVKDGDSALHTASLDQGGQDATGLTLSHPTDSFPVLSPDGARMAFISRLAGEPGVYVMDAYGSTPRRLTPSRVVESRLAWSPDGTSIAYTADEGGHRHVRIVGADGSGDRRLLPHDWPNSEPAWSPDGTRVAFAGSPGGNTDIYLVAADGSALTRLTTDPAADTSPTWSPNGSRTAFVSQRDGYAEVYVMNADGSGQTDLTNTPGLDEVTPAWSPDGSRIAYAARSLHARTVSLGQALGIASVVLQTALLMGFVMVAMRRWTLPLGAVSILFGLNAAFLSALEHNFVLAASLVVAGVAGDLLLRALRPSAQRRRALRLFSFAVPAVLLAVYFLLLGATQGIGWPIHLWAGSIVLAGLTGLLLGYVLVPPPPVSEGAAVVGAERPTPG